MGMKYVASYLLSTLSGKDKPTDGDLKKILEAAGGDVDAALCKDLVTKMNGKWLVWNIFRVGV